MKTKKTLFIIGIIFILLAIVVLFISYEFGVFKDITSESIKTLILSYGYAGPIIGIALIAIQTMTMVIPDILTVFALSALYGWQATTIFALIGSLIGASLSFTIGKLLGRDFVIKISNKKVIERIDNFFDKYGSYSILLARLIPFIPFDITSYLAGVTSITYFKFIIATAIGELPMTILYSYLGKVVSTNTEFFLITISIIIIVFFIGLIIKKFKKRE